VEKHRAMLGHQLLEVDLFLQALKCKTARDRPFIRIMGASASLKATG
jgi:hypothetical protein